MSEINNHFGLMHGGETGKDEWLTPPEIIRALGDFDLDPCAPINRKWEMARNHFTVQDDGLSKEWSGRVWMNPPYGNKTATWMKRLAEHGNGIALVFARTETRAFFPHVWHRADGVFFFDKRINFYHVDGRQAETNAGAPSCLVAYGENNMSAIENSCLSGRLVTLKHASNKALHADNLQLWSQAPAASGCG